VKRLGGFHLFDQLVGRLNRPQVCQLLNHPFQKANPPIDFQAFVTHAANAFARVSCPLAKARAALLFINITELGPRRYQAALFGVPRLPLEHFQLNLIRKAAEVHSQSIEHFPFSFVRSEVPDQGTLGCVPAELFQLGLIILHGAPDCYFGG